MNAAKEEVLRLLDLLPAPIAPLRSRRVHTGRFPPPGLSLLRVLFLSRFSPGDDPFFALVGPAKPISV